VTSPPAFPPPGSLRARVVNAATRVNVIAYKASSGRLGAKMDKLPVLLLEHTGRKSGVVRTAPLLYLEDGPDLVIVASRGGSDANPAWLYNLQANPRAAVTIGKERREVVARTATDEERERLWPELVRGYRHYEVYQSRTQRQIPVIILSPA
jgi:deazaflavin-dependent oxidoreductase (nitroreductase family)